MTYRGKLNQIATIKATVTGVIKKEMANVYRIDTTILLFKKKLTLRFYFREVTWKSNL